MSSDLPAPSGKLDPLVGIWPAGRALLRCHDVRFGATEFNPGFGGGRFHPFDAEGAAVPTLYAAETLDGALSETVFHDVPVRGDLRAIRGSALTPFVVSTLAPRRDLDLVELHGHGLRRLGLRRAELIDGEADTYGATRRWAEALRAMGGGIDGLVWVSRQHDTSLALVLFGDRVARDDLEIVDPPLPLALGPGLERVYQAAEEAGILVIF